MKNQNDIEQHNARRHEAEVSVLGGILFEGSRPLPNTALATAREHLTSGEEFSNALHRLIYTVMLKLDDGGEPINLITVSEEVHRRGGDGHETISSLAEIMEAVPTSAMVRSGVRFMKEAHQIPIKTDNDSIEVLTKEDFCLITDKKSLQIPEEALTPSLINLGMDAVRGTSGIKIDQYIYPGVMIHIFAALAGKIRIGNVHPSACFVKVGGTSTGKTQTDKAISSIVDERFSRIVKDKDTGKDEAESLIHGPTDIASGPAIMRAVQKKERCLMIMDEITSLFSSGQQGRRDPIVAGKIDAFLVMMTSAGHKKEKSYSDGSKNIKLQYPVVNILGNATPELYREFSLADLQTGLIQRADFFAYSGNAPYWDEPEAGSCLKSSDFSERLFNMYSAEKPDNRYDMITDSAVDIGMDAEARKMIKQFSVENIDEMNAHEDEGHKGIISRRFDCALKFALGHAGASRFHKDIFNPLCADDVRYGIMMAKLLANWKLEVLVSNISSGEFDSLCKIFMDGVKACVRAGVKPTGKLIVNRRAQLKNIQPKQWDDIVNVLKARKEIVVDNSGRSTVYLAAKS